MANLNSEIQDGHEAETLELAIQAVMHQLSINAERKGQEFYRKPYDLALHIVMAMKARGLRISVIPWHSQAERERGLAKIRATLPDMPQIEPLPTQLRRSMHE